MQYPHILLSDATLLPEDVNSIHYWMPKCAGTSIRDTLKNELGETFAEYSLYPNKDRCYPAVFNPNLKCVTFWHSHVPAAIEAGYVAAEWVKRAFGFAFVRNPWDRMVSLFHYFQKTEFGRGGKLPLTFEGFLKVVAGGEYPRPGLQSHHGYYQTNNLLDWLRPSGVWLPQFVGKFETLQEDWVTLTIILGLRQRPLCHRNSSIHVPYREYYDAQCEAIVAKHFAEEIDVFEYIF